jgi:redox-sensing transcriptional repressor
MSRQIPHIVVSRLPIYLRALEHARAEGLTCISSQELSERLGVSAAQIRKDLSMFGEYGKQGRGYPVEALVTALRSHLHVDKVWDVVLVGVGDLGHALARYKGFAERGFRITMAFDKDPAKIGSRAGDLVVEDIRTMARRVQEAGIQIGMIATPAAAAQEVANALVFAGVRAILNYAPIHLTLPDDVRVEYLDPVIPLQRMTYYLE